MAIRVKQAAGAFYGSVVGLVLLAACLAAPVARGNTAGEPMGDEFYDHVMPAPVTISVQDEEIQDILTLFSRSRDVNIITADDVSGKVSIELHKVPFDDALKAVASAAGFQVIRRNNIYYIQRAGGGDGGQDFLRDVRTYRLDYAKPGEILPVITGLLSEKGRASSYSPLRSIIVEDMPGVLENVALVIARLDTKPRQVLIEAKIIEARMAEGSSVGVDWSVLFAKDRGSAVLEGFASPAGAGSKGLFVTWGEGDITTALQAMETVEKLETLASPRLLALDGYAAEIMIGGQLGFSVVTTIDNTVIQSVQFLDTGTQLKITPFIGEDGFILMKIAPELSDGVIQEGLPSKTTTKVSTDVLVKDGDTLLIGGLIRTRDERVREGVPFLKDIPLLGRLFGVNRTDTQKTEVIILITPRILASGESPDF